MPNLVSGVVRKKKAALVFPEVFFAPWGGMGEPGSMIKPGRSCASLKNKGGGG